MRSPVLTRLIAIAFPSRDATRVADFYAALGFGFTARRPIDPSECEVLGVAGGGERTILALGGTELRIDAFRSSGAPMRSGQSANDLDFQHFAILTDDAAAAATRACTFGATMISHTGSCGGAVTLPPSSGSVVAVKLRDPECRPFEFLQLPSNHERFQAGTGSLAIDHSAIVTRDIQRALRFYAGHGLVTGDHSVNEGSTQAALDGLDAPIVDVRAMMPTGGSPHLELLHHRQPTGRQTQRRIEDAVATRLVWQSDREALLADPDGHLHQLIR